MEESRKQGNGAGDRTTMDDTRSKGNSGKDSGRSGKVQKHTTSNNEFDSDRQWLGHRHKKGRPKAYQRDLPEEETDEISGHPGWSDNDQ